MSAVISEGIEIMGSYYHSYIQVSLSALLFNLKKFSIFSELSIEINKVEYRPDIVIYPKLIFPKRDIIRMTELPLTVIEIISPMQAWDTILDKFEIYFNAGIASCWLVQPSAKIITVYKSIEDFKVFRHDEILVDNTLDIAVPMQEIFLM
jgi:Uma2 family endonuclease